MLQKGSFLKGVQMDLIGHLMFWQSRPENTAGSWHG
jgi:hypothetical protein